MARIQSRAAPPDDDDGDRVLRYIERHGAAAPKDIRLALGLSRANDAARATARVWPAKGRIVCEGQDPHVAFIC
jgi:hypothetical protein